MKNIFKFSIIGFFISSILAFKVGDELELTQFMNARSHPNFIKKTYIVKTLEAGTAGEISDIKKFHSGNFGLKMKLTSGPFEGETHWVYYNMKSPGMALLTQKAQEITQEKLDTSLVEEETINGKLDVVKNGYLDPNENLLIDIVDFPEITEKFINNSLSPQLQNCVELITPKTTKFVTNQRPVLLSTLSRSITSIPHPDDQEQLSSGYFPQVEPKEQHNLTTENDNVNLRPKRPLGLARCGNNLNNYFETCIENGYIETATLTNHGPNNIIPTYFDGKRQFTIEFNDNSLSDSVLSITETPPGGKLSAITESIIVIFPRKQVPSMSYDGNDVVVTLATGEVVRFDVRTKQMIGGIMSEGPIKVNSRGNALPAEVKYHGFGVTMRADKNNGLPTRNDINHKGQFVINKTKVIVSKKGYDDCEFVAHELWHVDNSLDRNLFKPEYSTDEGLDKLLKVRCGFTIN